ncbi:1,4-alpha-glucan branching protein [Pseudomonas sp. WN033]|nr:1,4-alpha-glucan branching protein [Pseudomonas sp. WN033]
MRPILQISKTRLNGNDLRQCLRIAFGGMLGFLLCKLMGWNYGAFFTVSPILLLGMVPRLTAHVARQFIASLLLVSSVVLVMQGVFGAKPIPMILLVAGLFALLFREMSRGVNFLFGAMSVVNLSMMLHFASYPDAHVGDMVASQAMSTLSTLLIALLMHGIFPDVASRPVRVLPVKSASTRRHEVLLATTVATLSFIAFQVLDLQSALSAQVASILVLFPLNWRGAGPAGWNRALGTLVGCNAGLIIQFVLMTHFDVLPFTAFGLWLGLLLFARYHMLEGGQSAAGFAGLTTMAILFGQYVTPQHDLFFSDLYRFSSLAVAVSLALMLVFVLDRLLNRFASTRWQPPS